MVNATDGHALYICLWCICILTVHCTTYLRCCTRKMGPNATNAHTHTETAHNESRTAENADTLHLFRTKNRASDSIINFLEYIRTDNEIVNPRIKWTGIYKRHNMH